MTLKYVAFYLPQYYPFPENDAWWGKGFTEWTNVTKATRLFENHHQPRQPTALGFYDLRVRQSQRDQIAYAKRYGIDAFCFHYYWFAGKRLLDIPVDEFLKDSDADISFCLCWANENWTRRWDGSTSSVLIAQTYTPENDIRFIESVFPFLRDRRYLRVNGRPLLIIYQPQNLPNPALTAQRWREHSRQNGIGEIHLVAALTHGNFEYKKFGYDAGVEFPPNNMIGLPNRNSEVATYRRFNGSIFEYGDAAHVALRNDYSNSHVYRTVFPCWDNTARMNDRATVFRSSTPRNFERWLRAASDLTLQQRKPDDQLLFINSWNEWAEGCHLEPEQRYGLEFLEAVARVKVGQSSVDDLYECDADGVSPIYKAPGSAGWGKFKVAVSLRLKRIPYAFDFARTLIRAARILRQKAMSGFIQARKSTSTREAPSIVIVQKIPLIAAAPKAASKSDLLQASHDAVYTAFPTARVLIPNDRTVLASSGATNREQLFRCLREEHYDSARVDFAKFEDCIANVRSISLVTRQNALVDETCVTYSGLDPSLAESDYLRMRGDQFELTRKVFQRIDEDVLIAFNSSSPSYGHFVFDCLPVIFAFEDEIKRSKLRVLLSSQYPRWMMTALGCWGFRRNHFLILPDGAFKFRSTVISNIIDASNTRAPSPSAMALLKFPGENQAGARGKTDRLYVRRADAGNLSSRKIVNENNVINALAQRSFSIVRPELMSMEEQAAMFRNASLIVSAHGSTFANLVWCRPRCKIIDLMPNDWVGVRGDSIRDVWVSRLAALYHLNYSVLLCPSRILRTDYSGNPSIESRVVTEDLLTLVDEQLAA